MHSLKKQHLARRIAKPSSSATCLVIKIEMLATDPPVAVEHRRQIEQPRRTRTAGLIEDIEAHHQIDPPQRQRVQVEVHQERNGHT